MKPFERIVRNRRGQASIMIGMMLMTFLLFFVFVLNTGMLVNAKINLQNAADLAAYAGAATQARQLNQIGYLNYEMRRQYKKFLFRYYVMGGQAEQTHPQTPGAPNQPRIWSPKPPGTPTVRNFNPNYLVPHVCIVFNAQGDNYCQNPLNPSVQGLDLNIRGDAITAALVEQLNSIERVRSQNCAKIADMNFKTLSLWLFNADPAVEDLINPANVRDPKAREAFTLMRGLAQGVGLVPRELLLLQRIKTLADYVNAPAQSGVNLGKAGELSGAPDPVRNERTLQAFFSAYYTLGNHTFSDGSLTMEELLPPAGDKANLIRLEETQVAFQVYAATYDEDPNEPPTSSGGKDCYLKLTPIFVEGLPVAVSKDPKVLTYYAIRLRARAKILFSPFGDVELKAYAAAQPFGSRIGPPRSLISEGFTHPIRPPSARNITGNEAIATSIFTSLTGVPNLPVLAEDPSSLRPGIGWDSTLVIGSMYQKYAPEGQTNLPPRIGPSELGRAYQAAMVPNPWETQYYNIPTDLGDDPFIRLFDQRGNMSFWAPVFTADQVARGRDLLRAEIDRIFDIGRVPPSRLNPTAINGIRLMKDITLNGLTKYMDLLATGNGENNEGMNIVRITDPFTTQPDPATGSGSGQKISLDARVMVQTATQAKTSWNAVNDGDYREAGRLGYSVKFVSFDSLTKTKAPTNGTDTWSNDLPLEDDAQLDVQFIKH